LQYRFNSFLQFLIPELLLHLFDFFQEENLFIDEEEFERRFAIAVVQRVTFFSFAEIIIDAGINSGHNVLMIHVTDPELIKEREILWDNEIVAIRLIDFAGWLDKIVISDLFDGPP
jgi:hypothetical protein